MKIMICLFILFVSLVFIPLTLADIFSPPVEQLEYTCTAGGQDCGVNQDTTSGVCRTIEFSTIQGPLGILVCKKEGTRYETYLQYSPQIDAQACIGAGCLSTNPWKGYDSFTSDQLPPVQEGYDYRDPSTFTATCTYNNINCDLLNDHTEGVCRTINFNTADGTIGLLACHKEDSRYELYRTEYPILQPFLACLGPLCVDEMKGFDSYTIPGNTTWGNTSNPGNTTIHDNTTIPDNTTNQSETQCPEGDPGCTSTLFLTSGNINGQDINPSERNVVVSPEEAISGNIDVSYTSTYGSNAVMAFGGTPNWGDHASSYVTFSPVNTPASGSQSVPVNYIAPTTPGTYRIILAYRAEYTTGQVFSMTNWPYGSDVWNDGNDIASWTSNMTDGANIDGRTVGSILTNQGFKPFGVPATSITIEVKGPSDGSTSTLTITSGTINEQTISPNNPTVIATPGQQLSGTINLDYYSSWDSNAVISLGGTPNWGDHANSYQDYGYLSTPGMGSRTLDVNFIAPTTLGIYYFIYSFNGQFNAAQVISMTSWARGDGSPVWNDRNDIAGWTQYQINQSINEGRTWGEILTNNGFQKWIVPATALRIIVNETINDTPPEPVPTEGCLIDAPLNVGQGVIAYDRIVGDYRYIVWGEQLSNSRLAWLTASKNGTFEITRVLWGNGNEDFGFSQDFCLQLADGNLCVNPLQNPTATVNSTCQPSTEHTLQIRMYLGFPADHKIGLECVADGFTPESYSWNFEDNQTQDTQTFDVYHTFPDAGEYNVTCSAGGLNASMPVQITVPFSPSLIQGENIHINSTLTVGGNAGEQWGTYMHILNQTNTTASLLCNPIGHRSNWTTWPYWEIPSELTIINEEDNNHIITLSGSQEGTYLVRCAIGVTEPSYYHEFWAPQSLLFHNGLLAFGFGHGTLTGYGADINITINP